MLSRKIARKGAAEMRLDELYGNEALKARLSAAFDSGRIAHSYLLCGPEGSGKHTLARSMAAAMQCTGHGALPCGVCTACRKVLAGQHPDVITVNDPEHKLIAVDVIRRMRADMFIRPNEGRRKIYILDQDMGEPSQNALLKILEEPPDYGVFLILTPNAEKMLATIRSRCAELKLSPLTPEEALPALQKQFPERSDAELRAALLRAGGYLGQAAAQLAEGLSEHTAAFAAAYAARDTLGLLGVLLPMEKLRRDQLSPVLEQWRTLLADALAAKSGLPAALPQTAAVCKGRTGAELLTGVQALQTAIDDLNANVGPGPIIGWLTIALR